jgi:hypothetical protein
MYVYEVKVRETMYLWGAKGIHSDLQWPLLILLRNDVLGEAVEIHTETASGHKQLIGTLERGQCYTLSLMGLRGVLGKCALDSNMTCVILVPQISQSA